MEKNIFSVKISHKISEEKRQSLHPYKKGLNNSIFLTGFWKLMNRLKISLQDSTVVINKNEIYDQRVFTNNLLISFVNVRRV